MRLLLILLIGATCCYIACSTPKEASSATDVKDEINKATDILYTMPEESELHEGTWLQWPHQYQYGETFRDRLDDTWVAMTAALIKSEKVHLIVYDEIEKERVRKS